MSNNMNTQEVPANKIEVPQFNLGGNAQVPPVNPIPTGQPVNPVEQQVPVVPQHPNMMGNVQPPMMQQGVNFMQGNNVNNVNIAKRQADNNIDIAMVGFISPQSNCLKRVTVNQKLARDYFGEIIKILKKYDAQGEASACSLSHFTSEQKTVLDANGAPKTDSNGETEKISLVEDKFTIKVYRTFFYNPSAFNLPATTEEMKQDKAKLDSLCYESLAKQNYYSVDMSEDKVEFLIFRDYTKNDLTGGANYALQLSSVQTKGDSDRIFILTEKQLQRLAVSSKRAQYSAGVDFVTNDGTKDVHMYRPAGTVAFTKKQTTQRDKTGNGNDVTKTVAVLKYYTLQMIECKPRELSDVEGKKLVTLPHRYMIEPMTEAIDEDHITNAKVFRDRWGADPTQLGKRKVISSKDMPNKDEFKLAKQGQIIPYTKVAETLRPLGIDEKMWNQLATTVKEKRVTSAAIVNKEAQEALMFMINEQDSKGSKR